MKAVYDLPAALVQLRDSTESGTVLVIFYLAVRRVFQATNHHGEWSSTQRFMPVPLLSCTAKLISMVRWGDSIREANGVGWRLTQHETTLSNENLHYREGRTEAEYAKRGEFFWKIWWYYHGCTAVQRILHGWASPKQHSSEGSTWNKYMNTSRACLVIFCAYCCKNALIYSVLLQNRVALRWRLYVFSQS